MARLFILMILMGTQGCGYSLEFMTTPPRQSIKLSRVYVYSFLDVRAPDLGRGMMRQIRHELALGLENRGVANEQHWFREDPLADDFAGWRSTTTIPVRQVIERNAEAEHRFGAEYRLIAKPVDTQIAGTTSNYIFTWVLEDTRTNEVVWATTAIAEHRDVIGILDEELDGRGRKLVDLAYSPRMGWKGHR
jgi:hypothetical protein